MLSGHKVHKSIRQEVQFLNFKELLSWIILQQNNAELFAMTTWPIWTQRNQVYLHQIACALHQIFQISKYMFTEFLVSQTPTRERQARTRVCW